MWYNLYKLKKKGGDFVAILNNIKIAEAEAEALREKAREEANDLISKTREKAKKEALKIVDDAKAVAEKERGNTNKLIISLEKDAEVKIRNNNDSLAKLAKEKNKQAIDYILKQVVEI